MTQHTPERRPKTAGRAGRRPSNAELQARVEQQARELAEAQAREQATAEVLATISRSPTDLQRVLDTVVERALRLCAADGAIVLRAHGDVLLAVAVSGEPVTLGLELPLSRGTVSGRAFIERRTIHVPDLATQVDTEYPDIKAVQQRFAYHSAVAIPLLRRDGSAIGTLSISRVAAYAFTEAQISLVQTFADQAVIAGVLRLSACCRWCGSVRGRSASATSPWRRASLTRLLSPSRTPVSIASWRRATRPCARLWSNKRPPPRC
jgi:transcriptional regulator with GAF, ATPase, and Fis domain